MPRHFWVIFALLLAGCGSAQVARMPVRETGVTASCAPLSPAARFAGARLVFVGVMLPGSVTEVDGRRVLTSPARVRVEDYLKGHGPRVVTVRTAARTARGGVSMAEDGIEPQAGQRWQIYTASRTEPFATSLCAGSRRVTPGAAALALWQRFPVQAKPRPIVPLGEGIVLAPAGGFPADAEKLAFLEGRFKLRTALPSRRVRFGSFHVVSSAVAYHRLRATGVDERQNVPPLLITRVRAGSATFLTDRGRRRLPAWQFFLQGVPDPASVLALAPADLFIPPARHRLGAPGAGGSPDVTATVSRSGRAIKLAFAGAPPGSGPCQASYRVGAMSSPHAIAFTISTTATPLPPGQACPALAVMRTAVLHLERPLGARVLVSASDGGAVPVTPTR